MKRFFKELFLIILLCIAILLVLGVLLYDDIPFNKLVPNKVSYKMPENIQNQLDEIIEETEQVLVTYTIDSKDLQVFAEQNDYVAGKADPFSEYKEPVSTNTTGNGNNNTSTTPQTNTQVGSNSTGNLFENGVNK